MSLRARVLAATVVLAAAGLLVADTLTFLSLRSFLLRRVDQQLVSATAPVGLAIADLRLGGRPPRFAGALVPPGTYAEVRSAAGQTVTSVWFGFDPGPAPGPDLPQGNRFETGRPFTVRAVRGPVAFRVLATPIPGGRGTLLVAVPLTELRETLRRLVAIEALVTVAVLAGVAGAGLWAVRLGLRPLERMGEVAGAIAGGDLSRRVEPADSRTEVGRLGLALNAMLARIEEAFARQRASEQRLRRFVADASHELRTPLTSIRGYAELFRRGAADRPQDLAKAMRRIEEEAGDMGVLVDDLLLLARLDEGRPLEREPVDLVALSSRAVADARAVDPGRPIDLVADGPVVVTGDAARLRQVLANLLSNARVHTPPGTPVRVRVGRTGGTAHLEVEDEGPGMNPEDAARAFERFFRTDHARSRAGAGLGLSIVAAIAEAHGGRASVDTAPGRGARFRVEIPVGEDGARPA